MLILNFSLRHLIRHWGLFLVVLAGILMSAAFAACPPMLAAGLAGQTLSQNLEDAFPKQRNLEVKRTRLSQDLMTIIQDTVGDFVVERLEIRQETLKADSKILKVDGKLIPLNVLLFFNLWSFDRLADVVELESGRLPEDESTINNRGELILEAALGAEAAAKMDLEVGDILMPYEKDYQVRVAGIVSPKNPTDEVWWGDAQLIPFNILRETGLSNLDYVYVSLIVSPQTMIAEVPEHDMYWRIVVDTNAITIQNADQLRESLLSLDAHLGAEDTTLTTGLATLIQEYQEQRSMARVSLLLLTAQSFLAILYTLGMISTFLLDESRSELASLASRGFNNLQITLIFAMEVAFLAFGIALPLGSIIAINGFNLWSTYSGIPTLSEIPLESWILSLAATLFAWLALVIPLFLTTRRSIFDWQRRLARPVEGSVKRQLVFDIALLALGGLAYWQLTEAGNFLRENTQGVGFTGSTAADPILLIGPTLFLFALGLIFLRLFPFLLRIVANMSQSLRGLLLSLGLNRLARLPSSPNRIVLLISLTVGLSFFATVFAKSVIDRQEDMAKYLTGADLRLAQSLTGAKAAMDQHTVDQLPGVKNTSQVYRTQSRWGEETQTVVDFLAIDPDNFGQVSSFPSGISSISMDPILAVLQPSDTDTIPIVLSYDAPPRVVKIGDHVQYWLGTHPFDFEVRGIIANFPTVENPFAITNLHELEKQVDLGGSDLATEGIRELWVEIEPSKHDGLMFWLDNQAKEDVGLASFQVTRIVDDSQARLKSFKAELVSRTANTAFQLNAIILGALSVGGFLLVQVFALQRRRVEFSVLRALGLSPIQLFGLLFFEGLILIILGLLLGIGVGYGLAFVMRPFLSLTLAQSLGEGAIDQVVIHRGTITQNLLSFVGFYILALLLLLAGLLLSDLHRTLRVIDE